MHPKLFIFGICLLLTYRTIEGRYVDDNEFSSETIQTEESSGESSSDTSVNVDQSFENQDITYSDDDVSESVGRKPGKYPSFVKLEQSKPNPRPSHNQHSRPPNPNVRPSPNTNHRPSRLPPPPPTRSPRVPASRPSITPPTRPPHTLHPRTHPTPTTKNWPDRNPTPIEDLKHTAPSSPPPPIPEQTTFNPYQTTLGYNAGIYTSTQHFTDKINGWLNVASGASDQINKEVSKWKTLETTPYNLGSDDVTDKTPSEGSDDEVSVPDDTESSATDSTPVDDSTPVSPDVTESDSTGSLTNADETPASSDNTD